MKKIYVIAYLFLFFCIKISCLETSCDKEKIALLFLARGDIFHQDYWGDFLRGQENKISVFVHSKDGVPDSSLFKKNELKETVPTTWANSLKAEIGLLRQALKQEENTKFIFASESTIPLTHADTVYDTVMATPNSSFYYEKSPHSDPENSLYDKRNLNEIPLEFHKKCTQWVILNRKHAQLMVEDENGYVDIIAQKEADNELYPGTFLASHGLLDEIDPIDRTYVNWEKGGPFCFKDLNDPEEFELAKKAIDDGFLFGRKFAQDADLSPLDDYLTYRKKDNLYKWIFRKAKQAAFRLW